MEYWKLVQFSIVLRKNHTMCVRVKRKQRVKRFKRSRSSLRRNTEHTQCGFSENGDTESTGGMKKRHPVALRALERLCLRRVHDFLSSGLYLNGHQTK